MWLVYRRDIIAQIQEKGGQNQIGFWVGAASRMRLPGRGCTRIATSNLIPPDGNLSGNCGCVDHNGSRITTWAVREPPLPETRPVLALLLLDLRKCVCPQVELPQFSGQD